MNHWAWDAVFYHIYPLGLTGAPRHNDFSSPAAGRLQQLHNWLDHLQGLGATAVYLGPVCESSAHGYDTVDYYHVDRRLGNNTDLARLAAEIHRRGLRLVLDAVFNHVGRDFWAFHHLRTHGQHSEYQSWFHNLRFGSRSPYGDPFSYEGWNGHASLVKLNLHNPAVKEHLFGAVRSWVEQFGADGLRLDAADCMDAGFLSDLAAFGRELHSDFWLVGEVVHGDYRRWANPQMLDSVTNYEGYKALYSSHNDHNYFELAYTLERQFGEGGLYRGLLLYNFADNHDVNRVASSLKEPAHLYPLYALLFGMPGAPSIYYGSEWGIRGARTAHDDSALRPALSPEQFAAEADAEKLAGWVRRLAQARKASPALKYGSYRELYKASQQVAFLREASEQRVIVAANASGGPVSLALDAPWAGDAPLADLLQPGTCFPVRQGKVQIADLQPCSAVYLSAAA